MYEKKRWGERIIPCHDNIRQNLGFVGGDKTRPVEVGGKELGG